MKLDWVMSPRSSARRLASRSDTRNSFDRTQSGFFQVCAITEGQGEITAGLEIEVSVGSKEPAYGVVEAVFR